MPLARLKSAVGSREMASRGPPSKMAAKLMRPETPKDRKARLAVAKAQLAVIDRAIVALEILVATRGGRPKLQKGRGWVKP
jgi:hypothetical protein